MFVALKVFEFTNNYKWLVTKIFCNTYFVIVWLNLSQNLKTKYKK